MNDFSALPNYQTLSWLFNENEIPFSLSEWHGMVCAYLCANETQQALTFLNSLIKKNNSTTGQELKEGLFLVFSMAEHQLNELDFSFQLLLPDDHVPLNERAQALSEWCDGFLNGLKTTPQAKKHLDTDSQEVLAHLQAFSELDYDALSISEEDEQAFMEIYEYTRMAVLRIKASEASSGDEIH